MHTLLFFFSFFLFPSILNFPSFRKYAGEDVDVGDGQYEESDGEDIEDFDDYSTGLAVDDIQILLRDIERDDE